MPNKRSEEFYEGNRDEILSDKGSGEKMYDVIARRWSRRGLFQASLASGLVLTGASAAAAQGATPAATPAGSPAASPVAANGIAWDAIELDQGDELIVAAGHTAIPFLRWGDPIFADAPEWDINNQTRESQEQQFGYNCD